MPHVYEVRPHKDHRGVDLIFDALPFGGAVVRWRKCSGERTELREILLPLT